ncbi:QacE family quaternary ammonium compound efflux SMR transporter [Halorhabdus sp. CBA1104]|uniref:DMT family transporter n=1 Tax=unclassified Halorhabdus TaxID=2621901 RepID=UPI0012B2103F|nr:MULTISPECIES: multidrug efflux SMR transporter [unclassified Halorhabdus]QGN07826.1 QacE family quaternary ammonium compound efflux SMR transporter [Halorhabdus sp. CBA1104]
MRPFFALAVAIASEILGTTALKLSDGFTNPLPVVAVVAGYSASFYFLSIALEALPIGQVYAIWAAVGIVGTATVGVAYFGESLDATAVAGLALVVAGVALLTRSDAYAAAH